MSWEAMCEQLAFDNILGDILIEGQDCLVMMSRWVDTTRFFWDEPVAMSVTRSIDSLRAFRQASFERKMRRVGSKVNRLSTWLGATKSDIQQEDEWRDEDIEDGYVLGTWRRPGFDGFKW